MARKQGQGEARTSPEHIAVTEKQRKALELRKAGKSYDVIACQLGYANRAGAYRAVMSALQKTLQEPADDVRKLEIERLETMWEKTWEWIERGDPRAIDRALHIMERRAKYLGLDAPTLYKWLLEQEAERVAAVTGRTKHDVLADVQSILAGNG